MQLIPGTMNLVHSPSSGRNWGLNDSGEKEHSFCRFVSGCLACVLSHSAMFDSLRPYGL